MATLSLLFLFCTSSANLVYCVEKLFSEPSLGQLFVLCSNILLGLLLILAVVLLDVLDLLQVRVATFQLF